MSAIAFISRPERTEVGDVFQYTSFSVSPKSANILRIDTVNDMTPDEARQRPKFEDLTPLFPDARLNMEVKAEPHNPYFLELKGQIDRFVSVDGSESSVSGSPSGPIT